MFNNYDYDFDIMEDKLENISFGTEDWTRDDEFDDLADLF